MSSPDSSSGWLTRVRPDHPRLFFTTESWPEVQQRATGVMREHLEQVHEHADGPPAPPTANVEPLGPLPGTDVEIADWGHQLMSSAFVYRLEPDPDRLSDIGTKLRASAEYYHACYAKNQEVNWYGSSRASCFVVLDWLWEAFSSDERAEIGLRLLDHAEEALDRPSILRRNNGDHTSGFYGAPSIAWFAGLALHGSGIDDDRALDFLTRGHAANMEMLAHRAETSGNDGGSASPTLGYAFGEYPFAEWNFLHTWLSATGEDIAPDWPYISLFPNYVFWNCLPGGLEFGYGDTPHLDNRLHLGAMYTHMSHIMHFYGEAYPDRSALARHVRDTAGGGFSTRKWSVYPFLLSRLEQAPPASGPDALPPARFFRRMGQLFMRSGSGADDTSALFACDGSLRSHRHYDATHFTIYRSGHLALDTGTRQGNTDNLQNYFAQTIAHNCILIKMPGEPPSNYWNGEVFGQAGGQNTTVGSRAIAFETSPDYTYVAADATPVYSREKCAEAVRQFVFLPPDHFVVFDRVTATRGEYSKRWLLHHANQPVLEGRTWHADQDRGRIFVRTLLPEDAALEVVGGPGKEFLADGVNYAIDAGPSELIQRNGHAIYKIDYDEVPELMGRWRMEVTPGSDREADVFLHLIQVGGQDLGRMCDAEIDVSDGQAKLGFESGKRAIEVSFTTSGDVGGHIRISEGGEVLRDDDLTRVVMEQSGLAAMP